MSEAVLIAVDGGNSKTDLVLAGGDGELLAFVRGPGCSPHRIGTAGCVELIGELLSSARQQAGLDGEPCAAAVLLVAGADLDGEEDELRRVAGARDWAERLEVGNDTLAVLRAGSTSGVGVAVVCGAGINALAVAADGRTARFPALGPVTGDWGGGVDLGLAALGDAVRAEDGRGEPTVLTDAVAAHFGMGSAEEVAFAVHRGGIDQARLGELAPLVLLAAESGDAVAHALRERLAGEIVTFVRAAAARVLADEERYDVVLGGGLLSRDAGLARVVSERLRAELPAARPRVCEPPPVLGSVLVALELLGAGPDATSRIEQSLRTSTPSAAALAQERTGESTR